MIVGCLPYRPAPSARKEKASIGSIIASMSSPSRRRCSTISGCRLDIIACWKQSAASAGSAHVELAGPDPVGDDRGGDLAQRRLVPADHVPVLLDRGVHHRVHPAVGEAALADGGVAGADDPAQLLLGGEGRVGGHRAGLLDHLAGHLLQHRLGDRGLGGEEAVDVGRRHAELGGDVGDRGLEVAELAEEPLRRLHDPAARRLGGRLVDGADAHPFEQPIVGAEPAERGFHVSFRHVGHPTSQGRVGPDL